MALPYLAEELEGSPVIEVDEDGTSATRIFRLPNWDDWRPFAARLVGRYVVLGTNIQFFRPVQFPSHPNLIVSRLEVEPFDSSHPEAGLISLQRGTNRYTAAGARVTAHYKTMFDVDDLAHPDAPDVPEGTYLTYRANLSSEFQAAAPRDWVWDAAGSAPLPDDADVSIVRPTGSFTFTWHRVVRPPWSAIRELRGMVNDAVFTGSQPGTLLFMGATVKRKFQFFEDGGFWEITYTFAESAKRMKDQVTLATWNHFFRRADSSAEENYTLVKAANSSPAERPYQSGDFTRLFQFG